MLGIIRVLTTEDEYVLQEHGKKMHEFAGVNSMTYCIPDQPNGIFDDESEYEAKPKIIRLAKWMEEHSNVDAITISCAADPAIEGCKVALNIPVLGAGTCGAKIASMAGNKVGVLGITEETPIRIIQELDNYYHSYACSNDLRKTTDLLAEGAKDKLLYRAQMLIDSGADVILFACTGFSTIGLKDHFRHSLSVPVVDLVEAQAIAYQLLGQGG
ncbi:hypothetical protein AS888_05045 [Peribacillus simplex]|uniref:Hydantoin racemase n=1 Tax=Peribacillus simplex TaxID=1478 RepID=A0A120GQU1_9BACI|nr:aspartate/glutamate racemase family protein [Peribacillus simplex]KWW21857.1 hypothetical protein AS888_05045 [Peribacillus simplex]